MVTNERDVAPKRRADVALQRVGAEAILRDARLGRTHVINATAAEAWELLDGRPMDELVSAFAARFGQPVDAVRTDVERLVARFSALGLVE